MHYQSRDGGAFLPIAEAGGCCRAAAGAGTTGGPTGKGSVGAVSVGRAGCPPCDHGRHDWAFLDVAGGKLLAAAGAGAVGVSTGTDGIG